MNTDITVLVIDSNKNYAKELTSYMKRRDEFLDAVYVTDGNDGYKMMKIMKPDVVMIDFLVSGLDAVGFLRLLRKEPMENRPLIIVGSVTMLSSMLNAASEYGADYFMAKPQPYAEVCNTIIDLLSPKSVKEVSLREEEENLDIKITRFLHYMGVPAHLNGYTYIRTSLKEAIEDLGSVIPITRKLYPALAKKYNKSPECIERSIRHAIKVSWERGNKKIIHDIFGYSADTTYLGCPTNSEYIAMVADDLRLRIKHDIAI